MKKNRLCVLVCLLLGVFTVTFSAKRAVNPTDHFPLFQNFIYEGHDRVFKEHPLKEGEFFNPLIQGCFPDPGIVRRGDDFFMVHSSFAMWPGVPIFHSKDLINWRSIGHVLDRPSQLKVQHTGVSHGIFAPAIKYNPHNNTFYVITTQFAGDIGNMLVTSKDPFLGWSDPYKLNFQGIDPTLFFDKDGKAYITHNDAPDEGKELYTGHRVIKIWDFCVETNQVIAGTDKIIVDGGVDITKNPIWIEKPHIFRRGDRYFLLCAEGGTGGNHSAVIFEANHPRGPWTPAPNNPILTQRYLDDNRPNRIEWTGHADIVKGPDGNYYGVFLGVRPNEKGRVNLGRETFILPVDWSGTFPVFVNGLVPLQPKLTLPKGVENLRGQAGILPSGNFTLTETFNPATKLDYRWIAMRGPREDFITLTKNGLVIRPFETNVKAVAPISSLFQRQMHNSFTATTTLQFKPRVQNELAGIICYQSENFNYVFGITKKGNNTYLVLQRTEAGKSRLVASQPINVQNPIQLQVTADGDQYRFNYSLNGTDFINLGGVVSGDILSTDVAGGFTGNLIGLYATTNNNAVL